MDKICVATTVHNPFDTRIYHKQIKSLENHYEVSYYAKRPQGDMGLPGVNGVFYPLNTPCGIISRIYNLAVLSILLMRSKYRVYCLHDPELWVVGALLKLFRKTVVVDLHEDFSKQLLSKEWRSLRLKKVTSYIAGRIEKVLPVIFDYTLLAEKSYGKKFSKKHKNLEVVYNFPHISNAKKKRAAKRSIFKMVYVGGVTAVRGIMEYLYILKALLDDECAVQLEIIGGFQSDQTKKEADQFISKNGLGKHIVFYGIVNNTNIYSILTDCQLGLSLLHPIGNYKKSYPTKLFEYMSVGLPALVSNFKLWESVVHPFECGYSVDPFDIESAVNIVKKYYHDRSLLRMHGKNGRWAIEKHFNWNIEEKKLVEVFHGLTGQYQMISKHMV